MLSNSHLTHILFLFAFCNYQRVFDEIGLFHNGVLVENRLSEIPVLTKETLCQKQKNLMSSEMEKWSCTVCSVS